MGSRAEDCGFLRSWLERTSRSAPSAPDLVAAHAALISAVWRRSQPALGDVTLTAVAACCLRRARQRHPVLACVEPGRDGLRFAALSRSADETARPELAEALADLTGELFAALARLTDGILLPDLRRALKDAGGAPARPVRAPGAARR